MTINDFIKKRPHLVWYTDNYDNLSPDSVVEAVLNYGNWDDVQKLIKILGINTTAKIFQKNSTQKRCNYRQRPKRYFTLYFKKYAS
ncbi:MAG: hypothetical protein ABII99_02950 [Patescibacteria group bacterium]|nr:hypothetical protein [Patescibacteria group bacterium]MBU1246931.1 hypothetical protein [Patescibacteria group bacterium]MBU1730503.1 hypothetical protein [Patescibacteria group bacterium]MBU1956764.1 hypothetical protein [Patescibacteria group bacterium]MBU2010455.1 hypothetical protein [Patescibacteria group bacterium]